MRLFHRSAITTPGLWITAADTSNVATIVCHGCLRLETYAISLHPFSNQPSNQVCFEKLDMSDIGWLCTRFGTYHLVGQS